MLLLIGLVLSLAGALVLAVGDTWLSRSMLVYLDAVEANVARLVDAARSGKALTEITGIDVKRDRRQNFARALKTLGWLTLALGFGLQLAACVASRQV